MKEWEKKTVIFGFIATFNEDSTSSGSKKLRKIYKMKIETEQKTIALAVVFNQIMLVSRRKKYNDIESCVN